jgi:D-tyrosyl-tRNA(Tyr) deacylase
MRAVVQRVLSITDASGEALVISQFTLLADAGSGRRPGFDSAMEPAGAEGLLRVFTESLSAAGIRVSSGVFGAHMRVSPVNDGPVTILLDSRRRSQLSPSSGG